MDLEQLKSKYSAVLKRMERGGGMKLTHVHLQDQKLFIGGNVGTQALKDEVWSAIKQADPSYADLVADIKIDSSLAAAAEAPKAAPPAAQQYTVVAGDTLSAISKKFYGDASKYHKIFEANKDILSDPDKIKPGQSLKIPPA